MNMTEEEYWETTQAMLDYGGSFVKKLAGLLRQADSNNRTRLLLAFPEYVEQYRGCALQEGVLMDRKYKAEDVVHVYQSEFKGEPLTFFRLLHNFWVLDKITPVNGERPPRQSQKALAHAFQAPRTGKVVAHRKRSRRGFCVSGRCFVLRRRGSETRADVLGTYAGEVADGNPLPASASECNAISQWYAGIASGPQHKTPSGPKRHLDASSCPHVVGHRSDR